MKKTRIYLVRHGETDWNASGKFQGHSDIALTERGREQAALLSARLSQEKISAFYSSDLIRARETAEILANSHRLNVNCLKELREINFGQWEGLTSQEISHNYGDLSTQWWASPLTTQIPDGESLQEVVLRCKGSLDTIITKHTGENAVVVAHGGVIRVIVGLALGLDLNLFWKLRLENVSLSIIEFHGVDKAILELFNDTCHLTKEKFLNG